MLENQGTKKNNFEGHDGKTDWLMMKSSLPPSFIICQLDYNWYVVVLNEINEGREKPRE